MKVKIYDQYKDIYYDNVLNKLTTVHTTVGQPVDDSRYVLVHAGIGTTVVEGTNLTPEQAYNLVTDLYVESQALGQSFDDKLINLNIGYAEMVIYFDDGRILNRVIFTE